ncbi:S16 family serine protease [Actinacidiphila rubida]|uniref:PDZ domain-containing protein n=1 Tax=Actinacidiphila rubida TaxID=310780 RepID=A0A1H8HWA5_9ACTN|nr:S16 family serine protease [Actinacidiphila rubida]SEN59988.1 PDZ domain-containing protein [Actinacidiphila rubida]
MPNLSRRSVVLSVCAAVLAALFAVAAFAPLPISIVEPGLTANVLGADNGTQVITVTGVPVRTTTGQLRLVTIQATAPNASVHFIDVWRAWFKKSQAAMPRDSVYPSGGSVKEIEKANQQQMEQSQADATTAALKHIGLSPSQVHVTLRLADVGGPSAGLLFSLGIIDKIDGDGHGGDLTGGRTIAGTGTIDGSGKVGAVGGVPLKEQAARRDGATVFLVPKDECSDAKAELPSGLKLVPVTTLDGALSALSALRAGQPTPVC